VLNFTEAGAVTHQEAEAVNHTTEIITKSLATFVPLLTRLPTLGGNAPQANMDNLKNSAKDCSQYKNSSNKEEQEGYQRAETAYLQLRLLEDQRQKVATGQTPFAGQSFESVLKETDKMIVAYRAQFFGGVTTEKELKVTFDYVPASDNMKQPLFYFSSSTGICGHLLTNQDIKLASGFFITSDNCSEASMVSIELYPTNGPKEPQQFAQIVKNAMPKLTSNKQGFYYRVPMSTIAKLVITKKADNKEAKDELGRYNCLVAQLGPTLALPPSAGGRRTKYLLDLYETTGALKNFTMGKDALFQGSDIDNTGTAAKAIVDANDELLKLKRKQEIEAAKKPQ
jgi:hypothetical protein